MANCTNGRGYARVLLGKYRQGVIDAEEACATIRPLLPSETS